MSFFKILSIISVLFIVSCSNENPIVGNWKLDGVDVEKAIVAIPDAQKDFARKMMNSAFEQVRGKMKLAFKKDGAFKIESPVQDGKINIENGTWKLDKEGKQLTTLVNGKKESIGIVEITANRLVLSMSSPGQGEMQMTFIPQ